MVFHIVGGKMKATLKYCDKVLTRATLVVIVLALVKIIPVIVAFGFALGYITSRIVMHKFISQLDNVDNMQLPSSQLSLNLIIYGLLFIVLARYNIYAMLSSFVALISYRKLFFSIVEKKMKEGGYDGDYN